VRAPGQGVVQRVEQERVVTVSTRDPTHTRHVGKRGRGRRGGSEVDNSLAVGPWASNSLAAALADEETVAGTPDILAAWRSIPDRCCLVTRVALDNMLILLAGDVDHVAADPAGDHGDPARHRVVGGRQLVRTNG